MNESFNVMAYNLLGYARIPKLSLERAKQLVDYSVPAEILARIRREHPGKGVLVVTLHYGSFESLVQFHAIFCGEISMLARGFDMPRVDRWWNKRREIHGAKVFARKGAYLQVVERLQHGDVVAILCDQNVKANHATFVDFCGLPAATTKSVGLAAMRTGARVVATASRRLSNGTFEIFTDELPSPDTFPGTAEEQVQAFSARLNQAIEKYIRMHPEQWFWIHRRWKTRPPGEAEEQPRTERDRESKLSEIERHLAGRFGSDQRAQRGENEQRR